ncbi:MAG: 30S ribosomal protein S6, partial [Rhodospirillaceae bacterium]|nr:30S ribosomal protein S6 [Rhodospirillaceae bacterium]
MPYYESVLIARQDLSNQQAEALAEQFAGVITSGGGKVAKNEYWGLKPLAYRIKKNRKGHFLQLTIDAPAAAVQEMERQMRLNEDLLRHLTLRTDELDLEPSIMMQKP